MDPISEESECKENTPLATTTKAQDNEVHPVKIKVSICLSLAVLMRSCGAKMNGIPTLLRILSAVAHQY